MSWELERLGVKEKGKGRGEGELGAREVGG